MSILLDLDHFFGNDLVVSLTGDLNTVGDINRSNQRVLRRLLTNPGDYLWQPNYGAGLARYIGATLDVAAITAVIRTQLLLEPSVARSPAPTIIVNPLINGLSVYIKYTQSATNQPSVLSFNVTQ